jgi:hypothetical protein
MKNERVGGLIYTIKGASRWDFTMEHEEHEENTTFTKGILNTIGK